MICLSCRVFAMNTQYSYMSIKALAEALYDMSERLEKGLLSPEEVGDMLENARALHERLVVLHFKAHEDEIANSSNAQERAQEMSTVEADPIPSDDLAEKEAAAEDPPPMDGPSAVSEPPAQRAVQENPEPETPPDSPKEERPAFRFGAPEVAPNQISLIDSIEEIKRMEKSINDQFKEQDAKSLADKLQKTPIADLNSAIGINMRFQFTSVLFENDTEAYRSAMDRLNACSSFLEADDYVNNTLKNRYDWQMKNPLVKQLMELVERRYL